VTNTGLVKKVSKILPRSGYENNSTGGGDKQCSLFAARVRGRAVT
jgi:hypothetical protein